MTARAPKEPREKPLTTAELMVAVRARFCAPEYGLLEQVRSTTGFGDVRTADALARNLYPSRGLELHGIEVKASAHDWRRELKDPAKAEEIARYCNRWWIVAGSDTFVQPGELPPTWGLLVPTSRRRAEGAIVLRQVVEATDLKPVPLDRGFIAAMMRVLATREATSVPRAAIEEELFAAVERGREESRSRLQGEVDRAEKSLAEVQVTVKLFEKAAGTWLREQNAVALGEAVALIRSGALEVQRSELAKLLERARSSVAVLEQTLGDLDGPEAKRKLDALDLTFQQQRLNGATR